MKASPLYASCFHIQSRQPGGMGPCAESGCSAGRRTSARSKRREAAAAAASDRRADRSATEHATKSCSCGESEVGETYALLSGELPSPPPPPHTHAPGASHWPPAPGRDVWHTSAVIAARWRARATNPPSDTAERSSRRSVSPFGSCRHAGTPPPSVSGLREGFSAAHGTPRVAQDARGFSAARRGRLASAPVLPGRRSCVSGAAACSARTPW